MNKRKTAFLKWLLVYPVVVFLCLEIAFRIMGYQHFKNDDYSIRSNPKNAFVGHPKLGIQLNPGTYQININNGLAFEACHLDNHSRYVAGRKQNHSNVLLLGCSFTYGFGVDDGQTFASLLQKAYPDAGIQNAGVIGYGSVQSLMQLKEQLEAGHLKVALLHFSSYHFMRNRLSQQYRSNLKIGYKRSSQDVDNLMKQSKFPYKTSCDGPIEFASWESMYSNWPGRDWFAAINSMQTAFDKASEDIEQQLEITACILKEMNDLCRKKGVEFGVVCLDNTPETIQLKKRLDGLNWLDVNFNFNSKELTNYPYDSHPNRKGHKLIADKIQPFLRGLLNEN